jgi:hypothetical protein
MTLLITVVSRQGLWQASDHRLTRDGDAVDDASMKHVRIQAEDGKALIAYAGIGRVRDTHISDWVRKVLRGASRPIEDHLAVLKAAADRELIPWCRRHNGAHVFSVAAFKNNRPVWYVITNARRRGPGDSFHVLRGDLENDGRLIHAEGTGIAALSKIASSPDLIHGIIRRRKTKASLGSEISGVLATLIRQASQAVESNNTVSPKSVVSYLKSPADVFTYKLYGWKPSTEPKMQDIAGQYDVTGIVNAILPVLQPAMLRALQRLESGEPSDLEIDRDALDQALRNHDWGTDKL